ncbi:MAG: DUF1700 domain-containing protein [Lachnospiraceae bacterium]
MSRQEFLTELRIALQGQVSQATINDNLEYYENYIMQESRKGRTEQEVLDELGNPRLLAKTIISSAGQNYESGYQENTGEYDRAYDENVDFIINGKVYRGLKAKIMKWTAVIAMILIVVGVISLICGVISLLAPILVPLLIILLAVRLLSGNRR